MVSLLFRVKASWSPRDLWRDITIGANRSLADLWEAINVSMFVPLNTGRSNNSLK